MSEPADRSRLSADADPAGPGAQPPPSDRPDRPEVDPPPSRWRYLLYAGGAVMIFIGLKGILHDTHHWESPTYWVKLFVGGALGHDLIFAPIILGLAFALIRLIPPAYRAPLQAGLFASGVLTLIALPGLRRYGKPADNPSVQPVNYLHGLAISVGVIWLIVLAEMGRRAMVRRRRQRPGAANA
jgi:hypothetical protein